MRLKAEPDAAGRNLDAAAKRYLLGLKSGLTEDEAFGLEFKEFKASTTVTSVMDTYKDKLREKIESRAMEIQKEEEEMLERTSKNYKLGKEAYECGEYVAAVKLLQMGVEDAGPNTPTGGDARLWLALSLQALGKEQEAVETCKQLEENHPLKKVRKQAYEIRYILEAPKLPPEPGETVTIPLLQTDTWRKDRKRAVVKPKKVDQSSYWDRASWSFGGSGDNSGGGEAPKWYVQVAWICIILVSVIYGNTVAKGG